MHRRLLALLAATGSLIGFLLTAAPANAAVHGLAGGGGMFAYLGLPSIKDVIKKVANGIFGALSSSLLPDFVKNAPRELFTWLTALSNPAADDGSAIYGLMNVMRASGAALLIVVLFCGVLRGMVSGNADHPTVVLARTAAVAGFLVAYPTIAYQIVALFNTLSEGLLQLSYVDQGINALATPLGVQAIATAGPFGAVLVLLVIVLMTGLLVVKTMLMYLVPLFFVFWPLAAPLYVLRETEHVPKTIGSLFLAACAIPAGWCGLFAVGGAMANDVLTFNTGGDLTKVILGPISLLGVFALALWWPFAMFSFAKTIPGRFAMPSGQGPAARAGGAAMKAKLVAGAASGGTGAVAMGAATGGAGGYAKAAGSRLAADNAYGRSSWRPSDRHSAAEPPAAGGGGASTAPTGEPHVPNADARRPEDRGYNLNSPADRVQAVKQGWQPYPSDRERQLNQEGSADGAASRAATDPLRPVSPDALSPATPGVAASSNEGRSDVASPPASTTRSAPTGAAAPSAEAGKASRSRRGRRRPQAPDGPTDPATSASAAFGNGAATASKPASKTPTPMPAASTDAFGRPATPAPQPPSRPSTPPRSDVQTPSAAEQHTPQFQAPTTQHPTTEDA
jgi:hypothetical protein